MVATVYAVGGPSGGGKTTFVRMLVLILKALNLSVFVLKMDDYYRDLSALSPQKRKRHNFDVPEALDLDLFYSHLSMLRRGEAIDKPEYSFESHTVTRTVRINPRHYHVIIIEGIFLFTDERIAALFGDASAYVDVSPWRCFWRRLLRDRRERGRKIPHIVWQYVTTVLPGWWKYVRPYRYRASIRVHNGGLNEEAQQAAVSYIQSRLEYR